jgi:hypothetical protein
MLAATMVMSRVCAVSGVIREAFLQGGTSQGYRCIVGAFANWCEAAENDLQILLLQMRGR